MSVTKEKGPFSIFPECEVSKWVLCLHACIYLSAIKQCGRPEISQLPWLQSKDVRDLDALYRYPSLITPPSLWCTPIIGVYVGVTCFFPSPSLPSACGSLRGESAMLQEEEVQLSAFISLPFRFIAVLWSAPSQKNPEETLASETCTGVVSCAGAITVDLALRKGNETQVFKHVQA